MNYLRYLAVSSSTFNTLNTAEYNVGRIFSNMLAEFLLKFVLFRFKEIAQAKDQKCALLFPFLMRRWGPGILCACKKFKKSY